MAKIHELLKGMERRIFVEAQVRIKRAWASYKGKSTLEINKPSSEGGKCKHTGLAFRVAPLSISQSQMDEDLPESWDKMEGFG